MKGLKVFLGALVLVSVCNLSFAVSYEHGSRIATLADTAYQVTSDTTRYEKLTIQASKDNAGYVYVGLSDVSTANGYELATGDTMTYDGRGYISNHYILADEAGDKVKYLLTK